MGYYAHTTETYFFIAKEDVPAAYEAACQLNWRNDLKSYGRCPVPAPEGPHPDVHFGWVAWNYHETCKDLAAVLEEFGFGFRCDDEGNLGDLFFPDDKVSGAEEHLLRALAPFVRDYSYVCWRGEDDSIWRFDFVGGEMIERQGHLVEEWDE